MKGFSMEAVKEVWNDDTGDRVEIGPDRDGIGLIEIRARDNNGRIEARMSFPKEQAVLIGQALIEACK